MVYFCCYELSNDDGQKSNFSSQKWSKFQILSYRCVIYLKRKLRTCTIKIQLESKISHKKIDFLRFFDFSPNARGPLKIFDIQFSEIFKKKILKWLVWDLSGMKRNKVKNFGKSRPIPAETPECFVSSGP